MAFHWNKGLPYNELSGLSQGEAKFMTVWEQLTREPRTFWSRKIMIAIPLLL